MGIHAMALLGLIAVATPGATHAQSAHQEPETRADVALVRQAALFLKANSPEQRTHAGQTLQQCDPLSLRKAMIDALRQPPAYALQARPGVHVTSLHARRWKGDIELAVRVPRGFDPTRAYPLLIAVPGANGKGQPFVSYWEQALDTRLDDFLLACPSQNVAGGYHSSRPERMLPLEVLDWLACRFRLDHNRVFLAGYSKGGHGVWDTGALHGDRFAGIIPLAGSGSHELGQFVVATYLANAPPVPVFAAWGAKDKGIAQRCRQKIEQLRDLGHDPVGIELAGIGHGGVRPPRDRLVEWLQTHPRKPHPTGMRKWFHRCVQGHCFWLGATALTGKEYTPRGKIRIRVKRPVSKERLRELIRERIVGQLGRLCASVEDNAFTITTRRVARLDLYVDPDLVDLAQPVTVTLNGRQRLQAKVHISSATILACAARWRDPDRVYVARVTLAAH